MSPHKGVKGTVHILLVFIHPHVVSNLYDFPSFSVELIFLVFFSQNTTGLYLLSLYRQQNISSFVINTRLEKHEGE